MSDKMLLVKFDSNYADEFDIEGFTFMTETQWEEHKAAVAKVFESWEKTHEKDRWGNIRQPIEVYFGTNEAMMYETLDSYLSSFKVTEISQEEMDVMTKHLGNHYGKLCMIEPENFDD